MMTLPKIIMWSEKMKALVEWTLSKETEKDEGGNEHTFILARHDDEFHKYSPNTTDEELLRQVEEKNKDK